MKNKPAALFFPLQISQKPEICSPKISIAGYKSRLNLFTLSLNLPCHKQGKWATMATDCHGDAYTHCRFTLPLKRVSSTDSNFIRDNTSASWNNSSPTGHSLVLTWSWWFLPRTDRGLPPQLEKDTKVSAGPALENTPPSGFSRALQI